MTRLLTYWLLLCACVIAQPELTNTEATNIDTPAERQAWREALELWTDDSPTFLDGTYTGDLSIGQKLTVGNGALDDTHIVNIVSAEDVITEVMLHLEWNSPTPAAGDSNALLFSMYDSALNETEYSRFRSVIEDPTDGTEDGAMTVDVLNNGVLEQAVLFSHDEIIMNDNGADRNFIVKDNTTAEVLRITGGTGSIAMDGSTLFVDSANNRVGVGTNTPSTALDIAGITTLTNGVESTTIETDAAGDLNIEPSGDEVAYFTSPAKNVYFNLGQGNTGRSWFRIGQNGSGSSQLLLYDGSVAGVKMAGDEDSYINGGRLGIGETIPDYPLHLKGTGTSNAVAFGIHASDDTPRFEILDNGTWQSKNSGGAIKATYDPTQYGGGGLLNLTSGRLWCSNILVPSGAMAFGTGGSNTSDISFNSNGAVAFKIEGTTGDLEIGTTNSITFADNSGTWDGATLTGNQAFTGNLTVDTNTLHVDSANNRVGIGTASPDEPLTVYATSGSEQIKFGYSSAYSWSVGSRNPGSHFGLFKHATGTGPLGTEVVTVAPTGNYLGIMETNPTSRLQLGSGSISFTANSGTWDGAIFAGNQSFSGQVAITNDLTVDTDTLYVNSATDTVTVKQDLYSQATQLILNGFATFDGPAQTLSVTGGGIDTASLNFATSGSITFDSNSGTWNGAILSGDQQATGNWFFTSPMVSMETTDFIFDLGGGFANVGGSSGPIWYNKGGLGGGVIVTAQADAGFYEQTLPPISGDFVITADNQTIGGDKSFSGNISMTGTLGVTGLITANGGILSAIGDDVTFDGSVFHFDAAHNNFAIGTTTLPSAYDFGIYSSTVKIMLQTDEGDSAIIYNDDAGSGTYIAGLNQSTGNFSVNSGTSFGSNTGLNINNNSHVGIGTAASSAVSFYTDGAFGSLDQSSDPANPPTGAYYMWMSDGTGSGDAGDIMFKINVGGTTKTITLIDYSTF